jgi:hypothetical protein
MLSNVSCWYQAVTGRKKKYELKKLQLQALFSAVTVIRPQEDGSTVDTLSKCEQTGPLNWQTFQTVSRDS